MKHLSDTGILRIPSLEWSTDADNQASGRTYGSTGADGSLIIGQLGVWSAGGRLIIVAKCLHTGLALCDLYIGWLYTGLALCQYTPFGYTQG